MADRTLAAFGLAPDLRLDPPPDSESLGVRLGHLIAAFDRAFAEAEPDIVLVQGDTSTTAAAAIAAFSRRLPIGHVEAGLRTFDLTSPFPEEAWRTVVGELTALHFAPTEGAAANLRAAGVDPCKVHVTGNTVIDALKVFPHDHRPDFLARAEGRRIVGVTLHRRENWNGALDQVMDALTALRNRFEDVEIIFVAHANPALSQRVRARLDSEARIHVVDPLDYPDFVALMRESRLMLSDSGGVQEEAPAFGTPVLVLRETTERPEAIEAGVARLVGVDTGVIVETASRLLADDRAHAAMARAVSPFGDGAASGRIARLIRNWFLDAGRAPIRVVA